METYSRTLQLERADTPKGTVRAVLATDGEASDGHILSMRGAQLAPMPLLFGHDAHSGRSNLGSWSSFTHGAHSIRGEAVIELDGAGDQRAWREDVAHMIASGHIGAVSVRWEPIGKPILRTKLAPAHAAYVDEKRETDEGKRYGYYFPKWRALEGSIVTLGSDKAALIQRSLETEGTVSELWRSVADELEDAERDAPDDEGTEPELDPPEIIPVRTEVARIDSSLAVAAMFARMRAADEQAIRDVQAATAELWRRFTGK